MDALFIGNSNTVEITGLQDALTDSYFNAATVSVTLVNAQGDSVSGEIWPKTMTYDPGSNGNYAATLSKDLVLVEGRMYRARITAVQSGITGYWDVGLKARRRQ